MAKDRVVRVLEVRGDAKGNQAIKQLANTFGQMNSNIASAASSMNLFKGAFLGFSFGYIAREAIGAADSMVLLNARLEVIHGGAAGAQKAMEGLAEVANQTKTTIDSAATIYTRLGISLRGTGISTGALLGLTETLINTFRISGSTIQEATATAIQFSQALSSNELRGQELRSVMEQNTVLFQLLSEGVKGGAAGLRKMAKEGKLTNEVVLTLMAKNMDKVNKEANKMSVTFGQVMSISFNKAKVEIFKFVKETKAIEKFATMMDFLAAHTELFANILATAAIPYVVYLAFVMGGSLVNSIKAVGVAMNTLWTKNPYLLAIGLLITALTELYFHWDEIKKAVMSAADALDYYSSKSKILVSDTLVKGLDKIGLGNSKFAGYLKGVSTESKAYVKSLDQQASSQKNAGDKMKDANASIYKQAQLLAEIEKLKFNKADKTREQLLADLNEQYLQGSVSLGYYREALRAIDDEGGKTFEKFKEGKADVIAYHSALRVEDLKTWRMELKDGVITLDEFKNKVEQSGIDELNEKLAFGRIEQEKYNQELATTIRTLDFALAAKVGLQGYLDSIGTVTHGIAGVIEGSFSKLEDAIFEFTKTGKANWQDFAQSILDELNRVLIRAYIIGPIVQGLLGMFGGSTPSFAGQGGVDFSNFGSTGPIYASAKGSVVTKPTAFANGGGRGIMGEAGPEAIMPLSKASDGSLGVTASVAPVNINIINNSNADISQSESTGPNGERQIDIMIVSKVKEAFANGIMDKTMQSAYGVRRKGT